MAGSVSGGGVSETGSIGDEHSSNEHPESGQATSKRLRRGHADFRVRAAEAEAQLELARNDARQQCTLLKEKLEASRHRQLMLEQKMAALEAGHRDEVRQVHESTATELGSLRQRLEDMENKTPSHRQLMNKMRSSIIAVQDIVNEAQYARLCEIPATQLTLEQQIQLQLYEATQPIRIKSQVAEQRLDDVIESEKTLRLDVARLKELSIGKDQEINKLSAELTKIRNVDRRVAKLEDLELQVEVGGRRNAVVQELADDLETKLAVAKAEVDEQVIEIVGLKQQAEIIRMDKQHLSLVNQDLKQSVEHLREQARENAVTIKELEHKRDEAYERLLKSQQEQASEFERKLHVEVDTIRAKNQAELLELRDSARQLYEQENRGYQTDRDSSKAARQLAEAERKEVSERFDTLQASYRLLQVNSECGMSELRSTLKMKTFEAERAQLLFDEAQANLKAANLEVRKQGDKVQVLTKEFLELKAATDVKIQVLEARSSEDQGNLKSYARLEQELDDVVMQAAESEDPNNAILSYGFGSDAPHSARRRLKQSVAMARKLLATQKELNAKTVACAAWEKKHAQLATELERANELIGKAQQPYNYLIEGLRTREKMLDTHKDRIASLEAEVKKLRGEKMALLQIKNAMSADLESLLDNDHEFKLLKDSIRAMRSPTATEAGAVSPHKNVRRARHADAPPTSSRGKGRAGALRIVGTGADSAWTTNPRP